MNILLFGPPGAGKGTQSAFLVEDKQMKHISTGDLLRESIKNKTALGEEAKAYMDQGKLVPDNVVIGMVSGVLDKLGSQSFILDGFPRTVVQAESLDGLLKEKKLSLDKALFLEVPRQTLIGRLSGRRVCRQCGAVYHVEAKPPSDGKTCDECGSEDIYQREDDKTEAVSTRLEVYEESTRPLKDYYNKQGRLVELDGSGEAGDVYEQISRVLED